MRWPAILVLCGTSLLLGGCSHHVFSPPARGPTLRSVRTLPVGATAVQATAHFQGALFGPEVSGGSVAVRRGLHPQVEIAADASFFTVTESTGAGVDRSIYAARVEGRFNPQRNRFFALFSGIGGGYAPAGGGFVSADFGLTLAFENCYVVPFASIAALVSAPIDAREVDTRRAPEDEPRLSRARTTFGAQSSWGVRLPIGGYRSCPRQVAPFALVIAGATTYLDDGEEQETFMGFSGGVELRF